MGDTILFRFSENPVVVEKFFLVCGEKSGRSSADAGLYPVVPGAIGSTLITVSVALPVRLMAAAKILMVAGSVAARVIQTAVKDDD